MNLKQYISPEAWQDALNTIPADSYTVEPDDDEKSELAIIIYNGMTPDHQEEVTLEILADDDETLANYLDCYIRELIEENHIDTLSARQDSHADSQREALAS